ncbi:MAG: hypothetical protein AAF799_18710 [Myxococcota bacterium]
MGLGIVAFAAPWWNIPRDQADSAGMLAHLHALFVDADLLFDDDYAKLRMSPLFAFVTDEGLVSNHWPAGATWLQAPGYALGVAASKVLAGLGIGRDDPLGVVAVLGVRAWAMLVLAGMTVFVARFATAGQSDPETAAARRAGLGVAAVFVVGTPLAYYAAESPLRPHLWGAAVCLAFIGVWWKRSLGPPMARTVALACLAGLATYVRPQLAPIWLLVVHDAWDGPDRWRRIAVSGMVFGLWPAAHLRTQLWMYGEQLGEYGGSVSHHTTYFLTSTHHGVLPWCPVLGLAAVALGWAVVRRQRGAWLIVGLVLVQIWLDGGMRAIEPRTVLGTRTWAGGVSFGPRKLVDVLPLLLPAAIGFVDEVRRRGYGWALAAIAGLLCLPTVLLLASAWLDPDATTGGIMTSTEYVAALQRPFDGAAWSKAWAQRSLPVAVALVVGAGVAVVYLGGVALWAWGSRRGAAEPETRLRSAPVVATMSLLVVHGWLAVVMMRSDSARVAQPGRMLEAARRMTPLHYATVRRIGAHHAQLRAKLGDGAAPPH